MLLDRRFRRAGKIEFGCSQICTTLHYAVPNVSMHMNFDLRVSWCQCSGEPHMHGLFDSNRDWADPGSSSQNSTIMVLLFEEKNGTCAVPWLSKAQWGSIQKGSGSHLVSQAVVKHLFNLLPWWLSELWWKPVSCWCLNLEIEKMPKD